MTGGDYWSSLKLLKKTDNSSYPYKYQIWTNKLRPRTRIEEAMYDWIQNAYNTTAQQIATSSLVSFANLLDKDEEREKNSILESLDAKEIAPTKDKVQPTTNFFEDLYINQIVPWLTVLIKWIQYFGFRRRYYKAFSHEFSYYRKVITGILPEAMKQYSSSQSTMDFVLKRLAIVSTDNLKLKIITDLLKLALLIAKNPKFVIPIGLFLIILLVFRFFIK